MVVNKPETANDFLFLLYSISVTQFDSIVSLVLLIKQPISDKNE